MQGTISILFGCHSPVHTFLVIKAWWQLYGRPNLWEFVCILLHDIGHIGKQYLDDLEQKHSHWELGARIARFLFGEKGFLLIAGHCNYSGYPQSRLYKVDKYSWYLAPRWFLLWDGIVEPKIRVGFSNQDHVDKFQKWVKNNIENDEWRSTHDAFIERFT